MQSPHQHLADFSVLHPRHAHCDCEDLHMLGQQGQSIPLRELRKEEPLSCRQATRQHESRNGCFTSVSTDALHGTEDLSEQCTPAREPALLAPFHSAIAVHLYVAFLRPGTPAGLVRLELFPQRGASLTAPRACLLSSRHKDRRPDSWLVENFRRLQWSVLRWPLFCSGLHVVSRRDCFEDVVMRSL